MTAKKKKAAPPTRRASSAWIKWEKSLESDPRFTRMVRKLRNNSVTAASPERFICTLIIGGLIKLWSFADTHIRKDNVLDLGKADIDDMVGVPGFADSMPDSWLKEIDESHVELPDFQEHNGVIAKRQALAQKRMANMRERRRDADVTQELPTGDDDASLDQTRPDLEEKDKKPPLAASISVNGEQQANTGGAPTGQSAGDFDPDAYLIWNTGLEFLGGEKRRSLLGSLQAKYGAVVLAQKLAEVMSATERPQEPVAYLVKALQRTERGVVV